MKQTATKTAPVAIRRKPDFTGTPGILTTEVQGLKFGYRVRTSPYDSLLEMLVKSTEDWDTGRRSGPRPVLKFGDIKAKPSLYARSKKLLIRVAFAETADGLYVRYEGRVDEESREKRRVSILAILKPGTAFSYIEIANKLRAQGDTTVDAGTVDAIMLQLMKAGKVVRQDGGAWRIKP